MKRPKIPSEHLTEPELQALLAAAQGPTADPRLYLMLLLMVNHGFRASELCGLKPWHIGTSSITMIRGKGGASGRHPLTAEELELLAPYLSGDATTRTVRLFGIKRGMLYKLVRDLTESIGLPQSKQSPHCLRHTCIKRALRNGAKLEEVQKFVGHKSLSSTGVYAKCSEEEASTACLPKCVKILTHFSDKQ